jgi:hypothetical protein
MSGARASRWLSWLEPGLLAALAFACVWAWPMLSRSSLPVLTDAHHHIYRTFEILQVWHEGILFMRWAPDFYYNYGYPVFEFYAPLLEGLRPSTLQSLYRGQRLAGASHHSIAARGLG